MSRKSHNSKVKKQDSHVERNPQAILHNHNYLPKEDTIEVMERYHPGATKIMLEMIQDQQKHDHEMDHRESVLRESQSDQNASIIENDKYALSTSRVAMYSFTVTIIILAGIGCFLLYLGFPEKLCNHAAWLVN